MDRGALEKKKKEKHTILNGFEYILYFSRQTHAIIVSCFNQFYYFATIFMTTAATKFLIY